MTDSNKNMALWDSIPPTDPSYTKNANVDGNKQTSISGLYMVKLATEALGPIGEGWGYDIIEERFDNTKPIALAEGNGERLPVFMMDGDKIVWEQVHTIRLRLWHGKKENYVEQFGHTPYRYRSKSGVYIDKEYAKKTLTDAMKKCLSLIGICSDVYLGMFDDAAYVQAAEADSAIKKAEDADKEYQERLDKLNADIQDGVNAIALAPNMDAVSKIYGLKSTAVQRLAPVLRQDPKLLLQPLDIAYFNRERELKEANQ